MQKRTKYDTYLSLPPLDVNQRYTILEATLYLRQSVARTYQHIADGKLKPLKDGGRTYIHGSEIARFSARPHASGPGVRK